MQRCCSLALGSQTFVPAYWWLDPARCALIETSVWKSRCRHSHSNESASDCPCWNNTATIPRSAASGPAHGSVVHLLQTPRLTATGTPPFVSGVWIMGWLRFCSASTAFISGLLSLLLLQPPTSVLRPPTWTQQSNIAAWASAWAARVASCSPRFPQHHHLHPCHQMSHFMVGDELHQRQAPVCFPVLSRPCAQAGVNNQVGWREGWEWYWYKALFTMEIES